MVGKWMWVCFLLYITALFLMIEKTVGYYDCTYGELQLNNGILEICTDSYDEWKKVCGKSDWGNLDAAVACKQLGYDGGYTIDTPYISYNDRDGLDAIVYHCAGTETRLRDCHQECEQSTGMFASSCFQAVNVTCVRRNASDPCNFGDIRLWGGKRPNEGNVELCTDKGVWSAIADYYWNSASAAVACRQLGYTNFFAEPTRQSVYGKRLQPVVYGAFDCAGEESSLHDCPVSRRFATSSSSGLHHTDQHSYAGVRCNFKTELKYNANNQGAFSTPAPTENTTTVPPSTSSTSPVLSSNSSDEINLCFRPAVTSLIRSNRRRHVGMRGLKTSIKNKIEGCVSDDLVFATTTKLALLDSHLFQRDRIGFKFNMTNTQCKEKIEKCIEESPKLQYLHSKLYLHLALC